MLMAVVTAIVNKRRGDRRSMARHVDRTGIGGFNSLARELHGNGELFERAIVAVGKDARLLPHERVGVGDLAYRGNAPRPGVRCLW